MWNLSPSERLRFWYDFRKNLNTKPFEQALTEVNHLWSYAPFVNRYLTTDNVEIWPNPWELIHENQYCDLAKVLGLVYTLYLTDHKPKVEIRIYRDAVSKDYYNLVFVDQGKYVLNYIHDEIVNKRQLQKDLQLVRTITAQELKLDNL